MVISSLMFLLLPMLLLVFVVPELVGGAQFWAVVRAGLHSGRRSCEVFPRCSFGIVVPDYALTVAVAPA